MGKGNTLIVVEGDKTDYRLMLSLLRIYGIDQMHEIVSYHTNIYTLYGEMFQDMDPASKDLVQVLKEHERDPEKKKLFDRLYSNILLIFDLDPQDPQFAPHKIREMAEYFTESSDMGKLYLNYPMVEAFYHMKSIPDDDYPSYTATLEELRQKSYKSRVQQENRNHNYAKFAVDKAECDVVIRQNLQKAALLTGVPEFMSQVVAPGTLDILDVQLRELGVAGQVFVLCTCVFYIVDSSFKLLLSPTT